MYHKILARALLIMAVLLFIPSTAIAIFDRPVPLSLDVLNPDRRLDAFLKPYMIGMRNRIEGRWLPNIVNAKWKTKVTFTVSRDGSIGEVYLKEGSGDPKFDETTLRAIQDSGPYPPIATDKLNVAAIFDDRYIDANEVAANLSRYQRRQQARAEAERQERTPIEEPLERRQAQTPTEDQSGQQQPYVSAQPTTAATSDEEPNARTSSLPSNNEATEQQEYKQLGSSTDTAFEIMSANQVRSLPATQLADYWNALKNWLDQPYDVRRGGNQ